MILLCLSPSEGRLSRWLTSGRIARLSHRYEHNKACTFTPDVLSEMANRPPEHTKVSYRNEDQPDTPFRDNPEGGTPIAVRAA